MKYFVFVLLVNFLLVDSRRLSNWANDIKHLSQDPATFGQICNSDSDCGEDGCCFWTKSCYKKPGEDEPCSREMSSCSSTCRSGLECTIYGEYNGQKFYRCLKPEHINHNRL